MPSTYTLIASNVLTSSGASSVTFSSIPQTFTDLVVRVSYRGNNAAEWEGFLSLRPNSASGTSNTYLTGTGSAAQSLRSTQFYSILDSSGTYSANSNGSTANTFTSIEWYIPNYTATTTKQISGFATSEYNSSTTYMSISANYLSSTSAITSLLLRDLNGMYTGSSFYLYGIKNS
jgi:hypothetical protein